MMDDWHITQETKTIPKLNRPIFIEGLPGIGNVGKIAVDFLIEEVGAKKLYSFFSYKFPNSVFVNEDNLIDMPKLELYYKKYGPKSKKRDLLLLTGDIQPIDEKSSYTFCEMLLAIIKDFNCAETITTGGIGLAGIPEDPKVYCTANDALLLKKFCRRGMPVEKDIFGVVGPIIGVSGLLLGLGQRHGVRAASLLAETFGHPMYLGIKGAKEILRVLDKRFSLGINLQKMSQEIVEVEKELMKKTKEWASELLSHQQAGAKVRTKERSYIG